MNYNPALCPVKNTYVDAVEPATIVANSTA
jgi:hypothetical protein